MKKAYAAALMLSAALNIYAQYEDGILINVQEVNIRKMKGLGMEAGEAVLMIIEQYVDDSYRFLFLSKNCLIPAEQEGYLKVGKERILVCVTGYDRLNYLLYAQVFYDKSYFFIALAKNESDFKRPPDLQITRMNYSKYDRIRRGSAKELIKRNNFAALGVM